MAKAQAERFAAAVQEMERTRDPAAVVELFSDDASLHTLATPDVATGKEGARRFWEEYLQAFERIESRFGRITADESAAVLEWESEGTLPTGKPIRYRGVSVIELAGDKVKVFRTYYDTAAFVAVT